MMSPPVKIRMPVLSALAACAIVAGCESDPSVQVPNVQKSGFLGDYSMLRQGGEGVEPVSKRVEWLGLA